MKHYTHLNLKERDEIFELKQKKYSIALIAQEIGRNKSTISRKLNRNQYTDSIPYLPDKAHDMAKKRIYILPPKVDRLPGLKKFLIEKLKNKWSPDVIAAKASELAGVRISTETLYQYIYSDKGKKLGLLVLLATKRQQRNQRHARKSRKTIIPERISIHERSKATNERTEMGHFEADLTFFKGSQSKNLMVITERKTRYTMFIKNSSKKTHEVVQNTFNSLASISAKIRKFVTFDNGTEFAKHRLVRDFLGVDTYFCDPHSPWQKGQVKKTNAMLRRFIPKKSSIGPIDEKTLMNIQNQFNSIPRKILGYKSPQELFNQQLQGVALQT